MLGDSAKTILRPVRIAIAFALASAIWIFASDRLADFLFAGSPATLLWINTFKGWFYVSVVTAILWLTLHRVNNQFQRQQQALAESEERFRILVENAGDAIYLCLPDGSIVDVNPEACRQTGYSRQELTQLRLPELDAQASPANLAMFSRERLPRQRASFESLHRRKNGGTFPVELLLVSMETLGLDFVVGVARDITERRRVEAQARAARDFLANILDAIPDPVFVKDRSSRFVLVNEALCTMAGTSREQLIGKQDTDFFPQAQAAGFQAGDALVMQTGTIQVFEEHITNAAGETLTITTKKSLFIDAKGAKHIVGIIRDITERKRFQDAIVREKALTDAILDSVPGLFYLYDAQQHLVRWNKRLETLTGYSPEELAGRALLDWFAHSPDDTARADDAMRRMSANGYASFEADLQAKNGSTNCYYFTNVSLMIDGKRYFTGVGVDISARKVAEDELVRSRKCINNILDSMPSVVIGLDDNGLVTHWNNFAAALCGHSRTLAMGRRLDDVFPLMAPYMEAMATALRESRVTQPERLVITRDGTTHLMDAQFYPLMNNGVSGVVLRIDDVTERERLREMMVQTEKMISVGGIAAGIAHEINNPLGIVLQATQNIMQRTRADFKKNVEAATACGITMENIVAYMQARKLDVFISDIHDAALRASATIRHMLDFSRKSESRRKVCDIVDIIDKALELASSDYDLKKSYDFRKITIIRDYADDLPAVNCTEIEMEQVFLNILRNAAQAMAEPRTVDPRIEIRARRRDERLVVEIKDNGPGMAPEVLRRAFEPFFTTKPVGVGTGLGLSVSYFIVTRGHGGTMTASSKPGQGVVFRIELPVLDTPEAA